MALHRCRARQSVVRGDFVLTPNMPAAVAPGDESRSVSGANSVADPVPPMSW